MGTGGANATSVGQPVPLTHGQTAYGFYRPDLPQALQKRCDRALFKNKYFQPIDDGFYTTTDGYAIVVKANCLYPVQGRATLSDGREVVFLNETIMNDDGALVMTAAFPGRFLADGDYILANGETFSITDGHMDDYGFFENGHLYSENRD